MKVAPALPGARPPQCWDPAVKSRAVQLVQKGRFWFPPPYTCCAGRFHPSLAKIGVPFLTSLPRTVPGIGKASMGTGLF